MKTGAIKEEKIDLRKLFNIFNEKLGNKLVCNKLYIIPSMRYWVDDSDGKRTGVSSILMIGNEPYVIEKILFNPDASDKEMIEDLKGFMTQVMVLGDHWEEYKQYKKIL